MGGYLFNRAGFSELIGELGKKYRLYAPVVKKGEGRFADTDVIRYDFIHDASEIELDRRSDYSFKEVLLPLSETLFYFTEEERKEADLDQRPILVFLRSYDIHALKRLDQIYLHSGPVDPFYQRRRDLISLALIAGDEGDDPDNFSPDMGTNRVDGGCLFSVERRGEGFALNLRDESLKGAFEASGQETGDFTPAYTRETKTRVTVPDEVPLSFYKSTFWDEYSSRCIGCGRCTLVCPTCTCYTMQDIYYTDNGRVGERRRVNASCMIDGYTDVAGGGQYRRSQGDRMRFKVLHKISDFKKRFGYQMCVGCGRCDAVCPEYISYSALINKMNKALKEADHEE